MKNLKLELFKSMEGHDLKRCEGECIHLKRLANIKYRTRGVPYPIKTSTLTAAKESSPFTSSGSSLFCSSFSFLVLIVGFSTNNDATVTTLFLDTLNLIKF